MSEFNVVDTVIPQGRTDSIQWCTGAGFSGCCSWCHQWLILVPAGSESLSLSLQFNSHFPGGPVLADTRLSIFRILLELRLMEMVVTNGAIRRAKLQSKCQHQQTNTQCFTGRMPFLSPNQQCQGTEWAWICDDCSFIAGGFLLHYSAIYRVFDLRPFLSQLSSSRLFFPLLPWINPVYRVTLLFPEHVSDSSTWGHLCRLCGTWSAIVSCHVVG